MRPGTSLLMLAVSITGLVALFACASGDASGLQRPDIPIAWPAADQGRRVELLFSYNGTARPVSSKGIFTRLGNWIAGSEPLHFVAPYGLARTRKGKLAVADAGAGGVHLIDIEGATHEFFANDAMETPVGVAIGPADRVFVTDSSSGCIHVLNANGKHIRSFGDPKELGRPTGIAYDSFRDRLLITDTTGGRILAYTLEGEPLVVFGERGEEVGQLNYPTNLCLDAEGNIIVVDTMNFRIQTLSTDFLLISSFGLGGDGPGTFARPKGVAIDSDGHIYVVDAMFDNVQIFDQHGELLLAFGTSGSGLGNLYLPTGIMIDEQNRIYVSDSGNSRIEVFQYNPGK